MAEPDSGWQEAGRLWLNRLRALVMSPYRFDRDEQRLVVRSVIIGAVVWGPVYLLRVAVHWLFDLNLEWLESLPSVAFVFLPLLIGAVIVVLFVRYKSTTIEYRDENGKLEELNDVEGDGLERAISLYHASDPSFEQALKGKEGVEVRWDMPTFSLAVRKFGATLATLGSGGSGGLEASVSLIGESLSAAMFKPRHYDVLANHPNRWVSTAFAWWSARDADNLQTAQLSGIAAAVATITGAPFTSAFFAAEVMYRRRPLVEKLIYSLISALVAYFLTNLVSSGHTTMFEVERLFLPPSDWRYYGLILLMAVAISMVSIYFVRFRSMAERFLHRRFPDYWTRHLLGAVLTGLIAVLVVAINNQFGLADRGESLSTILSTGTSTIEAALAGQITIAVATIALIGRLAATVTTIGSGGSAGLLIPALFLGTMVAVIFADLFGQEPVTLIVPAMTASLVSVVNVPLAAIMLSIELFSSHYILPAAIALLVCTILTQDDKIYRTQRETFDQREIVPGYEARRIAVPEPWTGKSLVDLDLRKNYGVTIIGLLEMVGDDGRPHVRLNVPPTYVLEDGDTIVALGTKQQLDRLEQVTYELQVSSVSSSDGKQ